MELSADVEGVRKRVNDKDQTDDPMSFFLIFHSKSTRINSLPITRRMSTEEEEQIQQAT
jgi:hypothetical protein